MGQLCFGKTLDVIGFPFFEHCHCTVLAPFTNILLRIKNLLSDCLQCVTGGSCMAIFTVERFVFFVDGGSKLHEIISTGVHYPLEEITEEERYHDLEHMVKRGNHKSALAPANNAKTLLSNYHKEVENGWMLPIPARCLQKLKGALVIPVGAHTKYTINVEGKHNTKRRTTHDASFAPPSNKPVNNRLLRDLLTDCFYGH